MTNSIQTNPLNISLAKRMGIGAVIGFCVIGIFVFGVPEVPAEWGKYWRIRPLFFGPFAGAMGGLCNYFIMRYHVFVGIPKWAAFLFSMLVCIVGMWMGIVLGLVGTMWH